MAKFSKEQVLELWSDKAGRKDAFDLREVESEAGVKQTQLINKDTGSLVVAVNATGADALQTLGERCGDPFIDAGVNPKEAQGSENKKFYTSEGVLATPTQPETLETTEVGTRHFVAGQEVSEESAQAFQEKEATRVEDELKADTGAKKATTRSRSTSTTKTPAAPKAPATPAGGSGNGQ